MKHHEPESICAYCGETYGRRECNLTARWHVGTCDVCGDEPIPVTEPSDYGGLLDTWKDHD